MKNKILIVVCLLAIIINCGGCASYLAHQNSVRRVGLKRALAVKDPEVLRAVALGDGIAVGIDVSNIDALLDEPWVKLFCGAIDAAIIYAAKEIVEDYNDKSSNDPTEDPINNGMGWDCGNINIDVETRNTSVSVDINGGNISIQTR